MKYMIIHRKESIYRVDILGEPAFDHLPASHLLASETKVANYAKHRIEPDLWYQYYVSWDWDDDDVNESLNLDEFMAEVEAPLSGERMKC
jgi:hypothetical protein